MRALIYTRISKNPLRDEVGVKRQERECRALAEREQLDVVHVFSDDDRSAFSGKRRPGYVAMLDALGGIDVVIAWHPDRLTRQARELEDLIDALNKHDVRVLTVQSGVYDLTTYDGRMLARMLGSVAQRESEHKSARLRSKHRELAEQGKLSGGGSRPYGYEQDRLNLVPHEAEIIREMARRVLAAESLRSIAADLNARGVPSSAGTPWHTKSVRNVLMSARIAGRRTLKGVDMAKASWPKIIDVETHRRLVAVLGDPARKTNVGTEPHLLTGLLRCGKCDELMYSQPRSHAGRAYRCRKGPGFKGCGGMAIIAEPVEWLVIQTLVERLGDPELRSSLVEQRADGDDETLHELDRLAARRVELRELWAAGKLPDVEWTETLAMLDRQQRVVEATMRQRVRDVGPLELIADIGASGKPWRELTIGQQRARLAAFVKRVDIAPSRKGGGRFEPERVSISFRA